MGPRPAVGVEDEGAQALAGESGASIIGEGGGVPGAGGREEALDWLPPTSGVAHAPHGRGPHGGR